MLNKFPAAKVFCGTSLLALSGVYVLKSVPTVYADSHHLPPPVYPWYHRGVMRSLEHDAIRRGFQVYKEVCHACHHLVFLKFRHMINISHTEDEIKAIAAEYEIEAEPDDEGNVAMRPRDKMDGFPDPYPNVNAAKFANGGAQPPDLSKIVAGREYYEDYLFSLLLGYEDAPEEMNLREGQHFNIYFANNVIGMGPPLYDGQVEYEDGTPATTSQMAKDVTVFLKYVSVPYFETSQLMFAKMMSVFMPLLIFTYIFYRRVYSLYFAKEVIYKKFKWRK